MALDVSSTLWEARRSFQRRFQQRRTAMLRSRSRHKNAVERLGAAGQITVTVFPTSADADIGSRSQRQSLRSFTSRISHRVLRIRPRTVRPCTRRQTRLHLGCCRSTLLRPVGTCAVGIQRVSKRQRLRRRIGRRRNAGGILDASESDTGGPSLHRRTGLQREDQRSGVVCSASGGRMTRHGAGRVRRGAIRRGRGRGVVVVMEWDQIEPVAARRRHHPLPVFVDAFLVGSPTRRRQYAAGRHRRDDVRRSGHVRRRDYERVGRLVTLGLARGHLLPTSVATAWRDRCRAGRQTNAAAGQWRRRHGRRYGRLRSSRLQVQRLRRNEPQILGHVDRRSVAGDGRRRHDARPTAAAVESEFYTGPVNGRRQLNRRWTGQQLRYPRQNAIQRIQFSLTRLQRTATVQHEKSTNTHNWTKRT